MLLAQQQAAQQQYIALLQQQFNAATALQVGIAAQSTRSSSSGNDNVEQQQNSGGSRKRGARIAGLDQQQNSGGATASQLVQNIADSSGCSGSSISGQQQNIQYMASSVLIVGIPTLAFPYWLCWVFLIFYASKSADCLFAKCQINSVSTKQLVKNISVLGLFVAVSPKINFQK